MSSEVVRRRSDGSHHWYWVAAIPAAFALWLAALAWLALASSWEAFDFTGQMIEISLVALGLPFVFLTVYFPVAVYRDAAYVNRTSGKWAPQPMRYALAALPGLVLLVALGVPALFMAFDPTWGILVGFLASVPFACYYLYRRHETVGTP